MDMVAHNAQGIEFKPKFVFAFLNGKEQHLSTFIPNQSKFAIITPHRNVIAIASFEFAWFSSHGFISMIPVGAEHSRHPL
jgi:hypothetical protein